MFGSKKAVIIVHGFAGGVYDLEYLSTALQLNSKFDVFTYTLPGHTGENIEKITHRDWIKKSENEIDFLIEHGYKEIYVIGHSMGGVIATYLAANYKEVKKLVLAAPAFRITGREEGKWDIPKVIKEVPKIFEQYGFKFVKERIKKVPVNFYSEFLKLIKKYRNLPKEIEIPTFLVWGNEDTIVPLETSEHLLKLLKTDEKKLMVLKGTTHNIFSENLKEEVSEYIEQFLLKSNSMNNFPDEIG